MSDTAFYIKAVEKWFIRNDQAFQDVFIFIGQPEPIFRKQKVTIKIKTYRTWEEYIYLLQEFKSFLKRVFMPVWSYDISITVLHTKKLAS